MGCTVNIVTTTWIYFKLTGMEAVLNFRDGRSDKKNIKDVNTEESYLESNM